MAIASLSKYRLKSSSPKILSFNSLLSISFTILEASGVTPSIYLL
ncbi:hypothetical protein [Gilliamella sp. Pas-s25]|nr:hypothetical protein [Gilliamella sp. Pas-s25]